MSSLRISHVCFGLVLGLICLGSMIGAANAGMIMDVRAEPGSGTGGFSVVDNNSVEYNPASGGGSFTMGVWAVVTGIAGDARLDGYMNAYGGFRSTNVGAGAARGDLAVDLVPQIAGVTGSTIGTRADVDLDGDLDVGPISATNGAGPWMYALYATDAAAALTTANAANAGFQFEPLADGGIAVKIGTLTFTSAGGFAGEPGAETIVDFFGRQKTTTTQPARWTADTVFSGLANGASVGTTGGVTITTPVPEPATLALVALSLLGIFVWRRRN